MILYHIAIAGDVVFVEQDGYEPFLYIKRTIKSAIKKAVDPIRRNILQTALLMLMDNSKKGKR